MAAIDHDQCSQTFLEPLSNRDHGRSLRDYLAGVVLIGLLGNALVGAWWLDPIVGFLIAGLAIQEGREAWRGGACCSH